MNPVPTTMPRAVVAVADRAVCAAVRAAAGRSRPRRMRARGPAARRRAASTSVSAPEHDRERDDRVAPPHARCRCRRGRWRSDVPDSSAAPLLPQHRERRQRDQREHRGRGPGRRPPTASTSRASRRSDGCLEHAPAGEQHPGEGGVGGALGQERGADDRPWDKHDERRREERGESPVSPALRASRNTGRAVEANSSDSRARARASNAPGPRDQGERDRQQPRVQALRTRAGRCRSASSAPTGSAPRRSAPAAMYCCSSFLNSRRLSAR